MEEQNNLLSQMETLITSRLEGFETRMVDAQRRIAESQYDKLQQSCNTVDKYQFRRKGNEEQYKCNSQVLKSLNAAEGHLTLSLIRQFCSRRL